MPCSSSHDVILSSVWSHRHPLHRALTLVHGLRSSLLFLSDVGAESAFAVVGVGDAAEAAAALVGVATATAAAGGGASIIGGMPSPFVIGNAGVGCCAAVMLAM